MHKEATLPADSSSTLAGGGRVVAFGRPKMRGYLHLVALVGTLAAAPFIASRGHSRHETVALSIYVTSLIALFGVSATYHRGRWSEVARRRFRRADHATIFFAIAGSYTAVAEITLNGWAQFLILSLIWVGAIVGVAIRELWLYAPKVFISLPYVVVGWCALAVLPQLWRGLGGGGLALLVLGGIGYTVGAIVYATHKPDPYPKLFGYHEVFHACTIIGASCQLAVILWFALPRG